MPPFSQTCQLVVDLRSAATALPGYSGNSQHNSTCIRKHLEEELLCADLEKMAPHLWVMTTFSGANINPLHRQRVKGRDIVVTEEPRLHLVWIHDRIFIKPLPRYLLCHQFWATFLDKDPAKATDARENICKAATGFLRTYRYLIQHESDFHIAKQDGLRLIPSDIQWESFCQFTSCLSVIEDSTVSSRYHYGELRLTRLNFYAPFFLGRFQFEQVHGQYGDFFGSMFGPLLFIFAMVSTILSSMQVALAADQLISVPWKPLWYFSRWFSVLSLGGAAIVAVWFAALWTWLFLDEWTFTLKKRHARQRAARRGIGNNTP